jgi:Family of unknown function (DUF6338)
MSFDTVDAILLALAFLVPGFILSAVLAMTFRRRSNSAADLTLQYLTFSCVNHGFWSWLIVLMIQGRWIDRFPISFAVLAFMIVFASPIGLGLIATFLGRRTSIQRVLSGLGFRVQRFIPTAWDFVFGQENPSWVIVRLKDGTSVFGFFGNQSFAGDDPDERDFFIEAVFQPDDAKHWQPVRDTRGILIRSSEIATIEFKQIAEVNS